MGKVFLSMLLLLLFIMGCSNVSEKNTAQIPEQKVEEEHLSETDEQKVGEVDLTETANQKVEKENLSNTADKNEQSPVTLSFSPFVSLYDQPIRKNPQFTYEKIIKEKAVTGGTILIYTKPGNDEQVFGLYKTKHESYELGLVGGLFSEMDDEEMLSIKQLDLYNKTIIRIKGIFGANAPFQNYYEIEAGEIKQFLRVETGHVTEIDLDNDGTEEIVTTHGTPIQTFIFKWADGQFFVSNVNESLGAISVQLIENKQFEVWFEAFETSTLFEYQSGVMLPIH